MAEIALAPIDYGIIIVYLILLIVIGYVAKKRVSTLSDYFVAGRRLTLPIFVATIVSTWYGGILGVGELSFNYGIVNWLTQGFFWYLSYLFFALFLAQKIQKSRLYTVPDQLARFYDTKAGVIGAVFNFIMVTPAPYMLSLGILFSLVFDWPIWVGTVLGTVVSLFYVLRGGFLGVIYTDLLQFSLMVTGVALVIPFAVKNFGGIDFLVSHVPATHFTLTGEWTTQMILVWGFIAMWTLVDPGFYQRCYAAKEDTIPKKGILIAILFWMMFDVCTTFTGIYARAVMPETLAVTSYAVFSVSVLPVVLKGLFFAGMIATIMSTIDSFTFLGAIAIAHDIYKRVINPKATDARVIAVTKIGVIMTAAVAMAIALLSQSLVAMWYTIGTVGISALLVPLCFGFFSKKKLSKNAGSSSMVAGALVSGIWLINGWVNQVDGWPMYIFGIEPMYPGLVISFCTFVTVSYMYKKKWM